MADGTYDVRARATDNAGNTANSVLRTVTVDNSLPSEPKKFSGAKKKSHLVLKWKPATDTGGSIAAYLVYANGSLARTLAGSKLSVDMGRFKTSDSRALQVAAQDTVGNIGPKTRALVIVPSVAKLTVAKATTRLTGRGLRLGPVSYAYSKTVASGRVIRSGKVVAFKASAIPVVVSRGRADNRSTPTGGETTGYTRERLRRDAGNRLRRDDVRERRVLAAVTPADRRQRGGRRRYVVTCRGIRGPRVQRGCSREVLSWGCELVIVPSAARMGATWRSVRCRRRGRVSSSAASQGAWLGRSRTARFLG